MIDFCVHKRIQVTRFFEILPMSLLKGLESIRLSIQPCFSHFSTDMALHGICQFYTVPYELYIDLQLFRKRVAFFPNGPIKRGFSLDLCFIKSNNAACIHFFCT